MRKIFISLFTALGLLSACGQQKYENVDVDAFAKIIDSADVVLLDVRTPAEYAEGHIEGALNIDQALDDFLQQVRQRVDKSKCVAVYCRSGKRSANAANRLTAEGYRAVNLLGGILAWQKAEMPVSADSYETDRFTTNSGKTVKIIALRHASLRLQYDGKEIQIDPVAELNGRTVDYGRMPKADYIFVTHEHHDHFDKSTLAQLTNEQTRLITNRRCADMLGSGTVMANGDTLQLADDIKVEAVPAYNTTEGHLQFHPKGRDNGYVLTVDGLRIYIAGDTEDVPEMAQLHDIDVAFLPCNQPYTMTPEQLLRAARTIRPKVLFPYHKGQTDLSAVPEQLKTDGIDVRIRQY